MKQLVSKDLARRSPPATPGKLWHAGSLTYTSAGLAVLFCWLLWGDFAWSLKERSIPSVVQLMLNKFRVSDLLAGLLIGTLPALIGLFFTPIISHKSDCHRGRWGRRIPFLGGLVPVAALSMAGLAFSPALGSLLHRIPGLHFLRLESSILIFFGLFWALFEFSSITANVIFSALINDVVPHPMLGRFYAIFRTLSLLAGMIFNYWILGSAETYYVWIFLGMGAIYASGFAIMCLKVKEGEYPPPPAPLPKGNSGDFLRAAKVFVNECYGNPYYLCFYATVALSWMGFGPVNLFSVFYARSIGMDMDTYGKYYTLIFAISLVIAYPIGILVDRFHPLRVALAAQAAYIIATLWGGIFIRDAWTFGVALVAHGVLSGTWMTAAASLSQYLLPKSKFAQYASAAGIVGSFAGMSVGPVMGMILDHCQHAYRYTYLASCAVTTMAFLFGCLLHARFMSLGGPKNYVAPE